MRDRCGECLKLTAACFCQCIVPISNKKKIIILQSKDESKHILNTGIMAKLTFNNISLYQEEDFNISGDLKEQIESSRACLFKPHLDAKSFESSHQDFDTFVFIDATWKKANRIYFENQFLHSLPKVSFTSEIKSQYFLRKEPKDNYLSTFEAALYAIEIDQNEIYQESLNPLKFIQQYQNRFY